MNLGRRQVKGGEADDQQLLNGLSTAHAGP
jgi:hypothetical protein